MIELWLSNKKYNKFTVGSENFKGKMHFLKD